jgi:hypothetical protein
LEWAKPPTQVLCFTAREVFTGLIPQMEKDLKADRKAAKAKKAQSEANNNSALAAFHDNVQNSIKVWRGGGLRACMSTTTNSIGRGFGGGR